MVVGDAWRDELGDADYVVCALPLTAETTNMLDAAAFRAMKPGAYLVNVARGGLVDDDALVAALESGHLGGAVLDAFRQEPVPRDTRCGDVPTFSPFLTSRGRQHTRSTTSSGASPPNCGDG